MRRPWQELPAQLQTWMPPENSQNINVSTHGQPEALNYDEIARAIAKRITNHSNQPMRLWSHMGVAGGITHQVVPDNRST